MQPDKQTSSDRESRFPMFTMEFDLKPDGKSEVSVICDIFGMHAFFYNDERKMYVEMPDKFMCRVPLSKCRNTDSLATVAWPRGWGVQEYQNAGYWNLGYMAAVWKNPELAEFLDNPGILVLLIANISMLSDLNLLKLSRVELVKYLCKRKQIAKAHIKWLKRVRPGFDSPDSLSASIMESLLSLPSHCDSDKSADHNRALQKIFSHQPQWTRRGLDLAGRFVKNITTNPQDLAWLVSSYNGNSKCDHAKVHSALSDIAKLETYIPDIVRARIKFYVSNPDSITPDLANKLIKIIRKCTVQNFPFELLILFITDDDVPSPVIKGNEYVLALDSLTKIRGQALIAQNCLWSKTILGSVILRVIDLYSVKAQNRYTISIDRETLDIVNIEAATPGMIKAADLQRILDWYEEGTRLPL